MKTTENNRISIPADDDALLAQCDLETFRSGGPGGQHQNKVETGVRLRHRPTGVTSTCRETRSQAQNRRLCLIRLRDQLNRLNHRPKARIETRTPRKAHKARLESKTRRAEIKKARRKPTTDN